MMLVVMLFLSNVTTLSPAQTYSKPSKIKSNKVVGRIISIRGDKIVIKNIRTNAEMTIIVDPKAGEISSLKKGEKVKVTLQSGTNIAKSVNKRIHKNKSKIHSKVH